MPQSGSFLLTDGLSLISLLSFSLGVLPVQSFVDGKECEMSN